MGLRSEARTFSSAELEPIGARMDDVAARADGGQWLNLQPDVDEGQVPTGSFLFRAFSSRGPIVPLGTWTPAHRSGDDEFATSVGIRHGTGRGVAPRLAALGSPVPRPWILGEDHQKRGLILYVPAEVTSIEILRFVLGALRALAPFDFADAWLGTFYQR